jgi:hypothetical protein
MEGLPAIREEPVDNHVAFWDGREMIVWDGLDVETDSFQYLNTGSRYNFPTDSWLPTNTMNVQQHAANDANRFPTSIRRLVRYSSRGNRRGKYDYRNGCVR